MTYFLHRHRAIVARRLIPMLLLAGVMLVLMMVSPNLADDPPPTGDLDGDGNPDTLERDPNPPGDSPGEVEVRSGEYGQLIVTIRGREENDRFGYSVAIIDDLNLDGYKDLVIGAPRDSTTGRAYAFYG